MRVAVDARRLQDNPFGGVGRWIAGVLPHLAATEGLDLVLLTDARRPPPVTAAAEVRPLSVPRGLPEVFWLQARVAAGLVGWPGVFHGTFNALPWLTAVPGVVSIYDLSFEEHAEDFAPAKRRAFQLQARHAARTARVVLTLSRAMQATIRETYRVPADRVWVVPPAVDRRFIPRPRPDGRARYVVAVGGARRRGLPVAVEAWRLARRLGAHDVELVIVGSERPEAEPGLRYAGALDDAAWAAMLAGADALLYPTRYEGFGMPAAEAMSCGVPVVCARLPVLVEVLGDAAAWCDTPAIEPLAHALAAVLLDAGLAAELRSRGLAAAGALPGWGAAAARVAEAYRVAVGR